ncbi:hypothetical protein DENSPDRAFT_886984 [Dentipellis sp. KUC8613]|nr:hypothetical protein DENSPDRAFT_886984 [Dentipellis sp. KUC8613]
MRPAALCCPSTYPSTRRTRPLRATCAVPVPSTASSCRTRPPRPLRRATPRSLCPPPLLRALRRLFSHSSRPLRRLLAHFAPLTCRTRSRCRPLAPQHASPLSSRAHRRPHSLTASLTRSSPSSPPSLVHRRPRRHRSSTAAVVRPPPSSCARWRPLTPARATAAVARPPLPSVPLARPPPPNSDCLACQFVLRAPSQLSRFSAAIQPLLRPVPTSACRAVYAPYGAVSRPTSPHRLAPQRVVFMPRRAVFAQTWAPPRPLRAALHGLRAPLRHSQGRQRAARAMRGERYEPAHHNVHGCIMRSRAAADPRLPFRAPWGRLGPCGVVFAPAPLVPSLRPSVPPSRRPHSFSPLALARRLASPSRRLAPPRAVLQRRRAPLRRCRAPLRRRRAALTPSHPSFPRAISRRPRVVSRRLARPSRPSRPPSSSPHSRALAHPAVVLLTHRHLRWSTATFAGPPPPSPPLFGLRPPYTLSTRRTRPPRAIHGLQPPCATLSALSTRPCPPHTAHVLHRLFAPSARRTCRPPPSLPPPHVLDARSTPPATSTRPSPPPRALRPRTSLSLYPSLPSSFAEGARTQVPHRPPARTHARTHADVDDDEIAMETAREEVAACALADDDVLLCPRATPFVATCPRPHAPAPLAPFSCHLARSSRRVAPVGPHVLSRAAAPACLLASRISHLASRLSRPLRAVVLLVPSNPVLVPVRRPVALVALSPPSRPLSALALPSRRAPRAPVVPLPLVAPSPPVAPSCPCRAPVTPSCPLCRRRLRALSALAARRTVAPLSRARRTLTTCRTLAARRTLAPLLRARRAHRTPVAPVACPSHASRRRAPVPPSRPSCAAIPHVMASWRRTPVSPFASPSRARPTRRAVASVPRVMPPSHVSRRRARCAIAAFAPLSAPAHPLHLRALVAPPSRPSRPCPVCRALIPHVAPSCHRGGRDVVPSCRLQSCTLAPVSSLHNNMPHAPSAALSAASTCPLPPPHALDTPSTPFTALHVPHAPSTASDRPVLPSPRPPHAARALYMLHVFSTCCTQSLRAARVLYVLHALSACRPCTHRSSKCPLHAVHALFAPSTASLHRTCPQIVYISL